MWEIVDAGDDGKSNHTERDGKADRERVGEDIGDKAVFDAVGVFFEREDEAGETDAGEVEQSHLDGLKGIAEGEEDKNDGKDAGIDGLSEEERGRAFEVIDGLAAFVNDARDGFEAGI